MPGADTTSYAAALKQHYYLTENTIPDLTWDADPLYALVGKDETFGGSSGEVPITIGHNQNQAATFATAQAMTSSKVMRRWSVTDVQHYGFAQIEGRLIKKTRGNANAFMAAATTEIDSAFKSAARKYAIDLYGDGWGAIGVIGAISTNTVTLATRADVAKFEVGMVVVVSSANSGANVRSGTLTVSAIDEDAGIITFTQNVTTGIAAAVVNDVIFPSGDREATGATRLRMTGLQALIPPTAAAVGTLHGVDRTVNKTRLGGNRIDGTAQPIEDAFVEAAVKAAAHGGKPTYGFCNYDRWLEFEKQLGGRVQYMDVEVGTVGFRSIVVNGPKGPVKIMPSTACPYGYAWVLDPSELLLLSMGKPIGFLDEDDLEMLRQSTSDGYEVRIGGYINLVHKAPGHASVITF